MRPRGARGHDATIAQAAAADADAEGNKDKKKKVKDARDRYDGRVATQLKQLRHGLSQRTTHDHAHTCAHACLMPQAGVQM